MSKLNPTSTAIALAVAGLVAAGCASQSMSDNESADNAASGQSDVVSQTNPLDQPAPGTSEAAVQPSTSGQQYSEASQAQWTQPATDSSAQTAQSASTTSSTDMASSQYDSNANAAATAPSSTTSSSTSTSSADRSA
jgi:hypothetical protein